MCSPRIGPTYSLAFLSSSLDGFYVLILLSYVLKDCFQPHKHHHIFKNVTRTFLDFELLPDKSCEKCLLSIRVVKRVRRALSSFQQPFEIISLFIFLHDLRRNLESFQSSCKKLEESSQKVRYAHYARSSILWRSSFYLNLLIVLILSC